MKIFRSNVSLFCDDFRDVKSRAGRILSEKEKWASIEKHLEWLNGRMPSEVHKAIQRKTEAYPLQQNINTRGLRPQLYAYRMNHGDDRNTRWKGRSAN
jgi:hypothetical protein